MTLWSFQKSWKYLKLSGKADRERRGVPYIIEKQNKNVGYAKQMLEKLMTQRNILPQITDSVASPSSRSFPCEY